MSALDDSPPPSRPASGADPDTLDGEAAGQGPREMRREIRRGGRRGDHRGGEGRPRALTAEAADVLYHLLVMLAARSLQAHGAPTYLEVSDCSGFFSLACGVSEVTTTILNHTPNGLEFAYGHNLSDPYAGFNFWMPYYVHGTLLPNRFTIAVDAPENWYVGASSVVSWAVAPTFDLTSFSVRTVSPAIAAAPVPLHIAFLLTGLMAFALLRRRRFTVSS
jgi:hypothetical protein